jgi:hypothetical protein
MSTVTDRRFSLPPLHRSLSARLLLLTIFFVMLSEVFIYAPSIGRFRLVFLEAGCGWMPYMMDRLDEGIDGILAAAGANLVVCPAPVPSAFTERPS